jgi:hypothetical protein
MTAAAAEKFIPPRLKLRNLGKNRLAAEVRASGKAGLECPAELRFDLKKMFGLSSPPDLNSLQIIRYDVKTGGAVPYKKYQGGLSPFDLPFRVDFDGLDPRSFNGMLNICGGGLTGKFVWRHTQAASGPSYYVISFDTLKKGRENLPPPRGVIGDGDIMFSKDAPLHEMLHVSPLAMDWGGKKCGGHLLIGTLPGYLLDYEISGADFSEFNGPKFLEADGKPVFEGWGATLRPALWRPGKTKAPGLLVGAERGRVIYYKNNGSPGKPVFARAGELMDIHGNPVTTPAEPCPELPVFKSDYSPCPEPADWTGKGQPDLLLGGYVTGMIFRYKNLGVNRDGSPRLEFAGPLTADGKIIDVGWAAAPCAGDFRGTGRLDLVCGCMAVTPNGGIITDAPALRYFKNTGAKDSPEFTEIPFPLEGGDWDGLTGLAVPKAFQNGGKTDLIAGVSSHPDKKAVVILRSIGKKGAPLFRKEKILRGKWEPCHSRCYISPLSSGGKTFVLPAGDCASGIAMSRMDLSKNPPVFSGEKMLRKKSGAVIRHKSRTGDDFVSGVMIDLAKRGRHDLLLGDSEGQVWLYENAGTAAAPVFKPGRKLLLKDGSPLMAGRSGAKNSLERHVGSRAVPGAGDFRGRGVNDLVTGDSDGRVTYFENLGGGVFSKGRVIFQGEGRVFPHVTDWDGDGFPDIALGCAANPRELRILLNKKTGKTPAFEERVFKLPVNIYYPAPFCLDWDDDGETDICVASSYGVLYFFDRCFLERGYAKARTVSLRLKKEC